EIGMAIGIAEVSEFAVITEALEEHAVSDRVRKHADGGESVLVLPEYEISVGLRCRHESVEPLHEAALRREEQSRRPLVAIGGWVQGQIEEARGGIRAKVRENLLLDVTARRCRAEKHDVPKLHARAATNDFRGDIRAETRGHDR